MASQKDGEREEEGKDEPHVPYMSCTSTHRSLEGSGPCRRDAAVPLPREETPKVGQLHRQIARSERENGSNDVGEKITST